MPDGNFKGNKAHNQIVYLLIYQVHHAPKSTHTLLYILMNKSMIHIQKLKLTKLCVLPTKYKKNKTQQAFHQITKK